MHASSPTPRILRACLALAAFSGAAWAGTLAPKVDDVLQPLPPGAVRVTGWLSEDLALCRDNRLLGQSLPDLIRPFRERPEDRYWLCEFWGKWYTSVALARRYRPDDADIASLSDRAVRELVATQTPDGYIGTYQKKFELAQWDVWGRKYVLLGLLAHHDLTGDPAALEAAVRAADYTLGQIGPGKADIAKIGNWSGMAAGSILEPMVLLYRKTGYTRFLDFANHIVRRWGEPGGPDLLNKALKGVPVFGMFPGPDPKGKGYMSGGQSKAYEMMSCYEGLAELYRTTGDPLYLKAVRLVTEDIRSTEITAIGSGSSWERWIGGRTKQTEQVKEWMETCVTATWIKFCAQLLRLTGDPAYADDIERTAYNALLSAQKADGTWWCHYNPLSGQRTPAPEQCKAHVNCCVAAAPRALFLLPQLGVMRRADGLAVNLYLSGTAEADVAGAGRVRVSTETDYPLGERVALRLSMAKPADFALHLRVPAWSAATTLAVNGETLARPAAGAYATLRRRWKEGDRVELTLDLRPRRVTNPLPEGASPSLRAVAVERGPLVLALDRRFAALPAAGTLGELVADKDGYLTGCERMAAQPTAVGPRLLFSVPFRTADGGTVKVRFCDYASAGRTWSPESTFRLWLPAEKSDLSQLLERLGETHDRGY